MLLYSTLRFMNRHPLTRGRPVSNFLHLLKWQIGSRLLPHPVLMPFAGGTRLAVARGLTGATGNVYVGLHEFEDMAFVLHVLRESDLFVDIGANVGTYSILASGAAGARTIAFEPVAETARWLKLNAAINGLGQRLDLREVALGATAGTVAFLNDSGPSNRVNFETSGAASTRNVTMSTLDAELAGLEPPVIKIDVEGFETAVLDGGAKTFAAKTLKCVIMELNGAGKAYGYDDRDLRARMRSLGFAEFSYRPFERRLVALEPGMAENVLFIRDAEWAQQRVASAKPFEVRGRMI